MKHTLFFQKRFLVIYGLMILILGLLIVLTFRASSTQSPIPTLPSPAPSRQPYMGTFDATGIQPPMLTLTPIIPPLPDVSYENSLSTVPFPTTAHIYRVVQRSFTPDDAHQLAEKFRLLGAPEQTIIDNQSVMTWRNQEYKQRLEVNLSTGAWQFDDFTPYTNRTINPNKLERVSEAELFKRAQDFLFERSLHDFLLSSGDTFDCYSEGPHPIKVIDLNEADTCVITYYRYLDGFTTVNHLDQPVGAMITLSPYGQILQVAVNYPSLQESQQEFGLIPVNEAVKAIESGNGTVVHTSPEIDPTEIRSMTIRLNEIKLLYVDNGESTMIVPVYRVLGSATSNTNQEYDFTIYFPALR